MTEHGSECDLEDDRYQYAKADDGPDEDENATIGIPDASVDILGEDEAVHLDRSPLWVAALAIVGSLYLGGNEALTLLGAVVTLLYMR